MTRFSGPVWGLSAAMLAALGACSGTDGANGQTSANAANGTAAAPAPAGTPAPALGPLTAQEICDRLSAAAVSRALGHEARAEASTASTPQCSYPYTAPTGASNITVAYQRTDDDLAGNRGEAGFDYVARLNRSMAPDAQERPVQAGQRALRLSGSSLHLGVLLVSGRVITVIAPAALPAEAVDRLLQEAAAAFAA